MIHNSNVKGNQPTSRRTGPRARASGAASGSGRGSESGSSKARRSYSSPLREKQAEATRELILDALVRTMADGWATLSVAAVAREAGLSIPTIYRHFGSKAGLLEALGPYVGEKAGLVPARKPETLDDLADSIPSVFQNLEDMDENLRAAMASQLGREARQAGMPWRRGLHRTAMKQSAPELPDEDIERLADLSVVLTSSATFRAYRDYLGLDVEQAAERAAWALRTMVQGARSRARERKPAKGAWDDPRPRSDHLHFDREWATDGHPRPGRRHRCRDRRR